MPTRDPLQREADRQRILQMYRRGWTQEDIGKELGISGVMVCKEIKKLREGWSRSINTDLTYMALQQLDAYTDMLKELYAAWEKSKADANKRVVEKRYASLYGDEVRGNGGSTPTAEEKVTETVQGRLPAAEYMKQIADVRKAIRELFGLDAAQKVEVNANVFNWDQLAGAVPQEIPDKVLEEIERLTAPLPLEDQGGEEGVFRPIYNIEGQSLISGEESGS